MSVQLPLFQVAEVQLVYSTKIPAMDRTKIENSRDAAEIFRTHWNHDHIELLEEAYLMLVNRANRVLGIVKLSQGGIAGTIIDPKIVFVTALKAAASGLFLCHNHPSGNLTASQSDITLTRKIKEGAKLLELTLMDHIIITKDSHVSMAEEGLL